MAVVTELNLETQVLTEMWIDGNEVKRHESGLTLEELEHQGTAFFDSVPYLGKTTTTEHVISALIQALDYGNEYDVLIFQKREQIQNPKQAPGAKPTHKTRVYFDFYKRLDF